MKSTDEVVTEHLGPPVIPRGQRRAMLLLLAAIAVVLLGFYVLIGALGIGRFTAPTPGISSPVDGVVTAVDSSGLANVRGFTLRASLGGFVFTGDFTLGVLENATEFSPSHLAEHQASSVPIRVWYREENGVRVAYRLEDAP